MGDATQCEQWKSLITRLPGVLGAEFSLENGAIREVHILSDQSRGPKQIVRDVQSALLTRFQLELDHRIISVAQISGALLEDDKRVLFDHLELTSGRENSDAAVYLHAEDAVWVGKASSDLSSAGRYRAVALATVDALNQLLSVDCRLALEEVRRLPVAEHQAVLVGLRLNIAGRAEALLGACYEREDPNFAAALATLDAVNRRLCTLPRVAGSEDRPA